MIRPKTPSSAAGSLKPLAIAIIAASLSACISFAQTGGSGQPDDLPALRELATSLVNEERSAKGLGEVGQDGILNRIAQSHASDMLRRDYYSHVSPGGDDVQDRYIDAGGNKWRLVEENIATCTGCAATREEVRALQKGWMNSPEHRENILRRGIDRFGFGIAGRDGRVYAVQTFAGPGSSGGGAEEAASAASLRQTALQRINEARKEAGVAPLQLSEALSEGAQAMLPAADASSFQPGSMRELTGALPAETRASFRRYATAIGICGGCGTVATTADAEDFVGQWLGNPSQKSRLLDERFTHVGFAVAADGEGKKIGVAAFAEPR